MGAAGLATISAYFPLNNDVKTWLLYLPIMVVFVVGVIGFTGAFGVPLPWPFAPRWVSRLRREKRARARLRRQARKARKQR